jgi:hypothetical protein
LDGLNFSPRNMQQLLNNALKDAASVSLTTTGGDQLSVRAPIELGTECLSFATSENGRPITVVPYHAIQRVHIE